MPSCHLSSQCRSRRRSLRTGSVTVARHCCTTPTMRYHMRIIRWLDWCLRTYYYNVHCTKLVSRERCFKNYHHSPLQLPLPSDEMAASVNEMTLLSFQPVSAENSQSMPLQQNEKRQSLPDSLPSLAPIHGMETSLKALAEASNITLEALEAAILLRQQQLLKKQQGPMITSTSTTTSTVAPTKK